MRRQGLEPRTRRLRGKSGLSADVRGRPPRRHDLGSPSAGVRTRPPMLAGSGTAMGTRRQVGACTYAAHATRSGNLCRGCRRPGFSRSGPGQRRSAPHQRSQIGPYADRCYWHANGTKRVPVARCRFDRVPCVADSSWLGRPKPYRVVPLVSGRQWSPSPSAGGCAEVPGVWDGSRESARGQRARARARQEATQMVLIAMVASGYPSATMATAAARTKTVPRTTTRVWAASESTCLRRGGCGSSPGEVPLVDLVGMRQGSGELRS